MRFIGIGVVAALTMFALAPTGAAAAPKKDAIATMMAAKNHQRGVAEAPALIVAAGARCAISDARLMGEDKKTGVAVYEVACSDNLGFVVEAKAQKEGPPVFQNLYTCLTTATPTADGQPNALQCELADNVDPAVRVQAYVDKYGRPCAVDKSRYVGQTQKEVYLEVACKNGVGYMLVTSWPPDPASPIQMNTCLIYEADNKLGCELTERSAQLAPVDALVAKSGRPCTVKDRRYVLSTKDGDNYFEVACEGGAGYIVQENGKGALARILDCASADFVAGGCTMTDTRSAQTEQAALYTKLATKAGFPCDVAKYSPLPTTGAKEVVELQCSNRPDGGIAVFTAQGGKVYNCVMAELEGYRCSFSKKDAVFPVLTADLRTLGKSQCIVSDARVIGKGADEGFVEVACSDGLPGWVLGYPNNGKPELLICKQAANIGGGCKLPTNRRN